MTRARDLADSADKDIAGTLTLDDLTVGGTAYVTGDLTVDTDTLYVDTTNNRVGIGTASPNGVLSLKKSTRTLDIKLEDTAASGEYGVQFTAGSGDFLGFGAGGSGTAIAIDSSNRVTMPNQPSFYAYPSSNTVHTVNQWNTVAFNITGWNVGGHFNTSNYRFTAPVSGKYQMTWTFQLENNNAPTWIYAYPIVNGNRNTDRSRGVSFSDFMTSQYYHTENGTWILNLSANDYVTMDIYTSGATKEFKAESSWSGYLIG